MVLRQQSAVAQRQRGILVHRHFRPWARRKGHRLIGVEIDAQGMVPQALASALERVSSGHIAVYLTPTLHNPTTATMSAERRRAIVEICRQANVWIIEDGVYALGHSAVPALATLAPERVFHVNGLSKTLGPGLRIGMLTLPPDMQTAAEEALQDIPFAPSPLSCAVVGEWLSSGAIEAIPQALRHEAQRRVHLATSIFDADECVSHPDAYHVWLPMPRETAESVAAAAALAGVRVTPPAAVMVNDGESESGIRLCLGSPSLDELTAGLTQLAQLLKAHRNG